MRLFLVSRRNGNLHAVRAFPEAAASVVDREAEVLRGAGFEAKVLVGADLGEVLSANPSWFAEREAVSR